MVGDPNRAPTREEVDGKVSEMQQKLAELKRVQQELERERAGLEETRRRQIEFTTGRQEIMQQLTRGVGLLEEAEFGARRDAEQMAKTVAELREALSKVQSVQEETWSRDNFPVELTRGLTTIENARMEWNAARLKFPMLDGAITSAEKVTAPMHAGPQLLSPRNYREVCKLGLALTWPAVLAALAVVLALLLRR
jgi:DNA repair exonuclease SbcCD ATPase subunit